MADGYLNFDTKINEKGFNDGISKLCGLAGKGVGSIAGIASKANGIFTALSGSVAGVIIKQSLGVVANMEQQVGGVETLFKDSANTVIANANKAYKTAGMSANNYMETVTSFSASLLQSLGGDTAKAASYADRAIVDMSDNANKMGTNMRDIQNAYQGFAKQNYTMLDNLKLGYGGTQEEMKRLISDASKMTDVQKELGVTVDASSLSFGNIVNAISVVQKQMGITGTTSKEAATTIEGSVNSAKAAWENFEAGVISANDLVETFWTAAQNIFTNLGQIIPRLGKTGMDVVSALAGKIGGAVPQVKGFTDSISKLASELKGMNSDQLSNLGKMAVVIAGSAPALSIFGKGIENVKTATDGFNDIVDGVVTSIGKVPKGAKSASATSIGKVPKEAKSASATLKKIGGEFKFLGESIALPFQDLGEKIAPRLKDLGGFMVESWTNGPGGKITGAVTNTVKKIGESFGKIGPKLAEKFPGITKKFAELGAKMSAASAKVSKVLGKVGTKISEYAGFIGNAFTPILSRVASFAPTFFKLINIGAGAAIIVAGMGLIYSQFGTQIDQLLLLVQTKGPEVITNFANGITAALPGLVAQGATLIMGILNAITVNLQALVSAGVSIISTLAGSLGAQLPQLIPCAVRMIMTLVSSLAGNLPKLIQSGLKLMKGLASGIANSIPIVAAKAPIIIGKLASTIITNLPKILTAGVQIVSKLAVGLVRGIPALIGKIPSMVSQIRNAFTSVNWGSVGMNIVKGIASGLANAGGVIVKAAKSAAKSALDAAKSALGIHSPSRVFRDQVGKMMALGMGIGFEKNIPLKSMNVGVQRAVSGLQKSVDLALSARTVDKTVGRVKSYPGFDGGKDIDYDRLERIQMKAADKLSKRPIYLGTKRIDEPLPKGAVPVW